MVFRSDLRTDMFIATLDPNVFIAPAEVDSQLMMNNDGDFELRDLDGTVKTFASFNDPDMPGRLIRMEDSSGNLMTFHYEPIDPDNNVAGDEKFVLAYVIDTMGREIRYQYYARTAQTVSGRQLTITHPTAETGAFAQFNVETNLRHDAAEKAEKADLLLHGFQLT